MKHEHMFCKHIRARLAVGAMVWVGAITTGTAMAAPPAPTPAYNWGGGYLGFYIGGGANSSSYSNSDNGFLGTMNMSGFISNFAAGYNWQLRNNFVVGLEVSGGPANVSGSFIADGWQFNSRIQGIETLAARFGFATGANGNLLWYGKFGGALAQYKFGSNWPEIDATFAASKTLSGWTAGAGLEYGFVPNFSLRIEYDHYGLGGGTVNLTSNNELVPIYPANINRWGADSGYVGITYKIPVMGATR